MSEPRRMGPLNARDQSAIDSGCNCARRMGYTCWSHDLDCPLFLDRWVSPQGIIYRVGVDPGQGDRGAAVSNTGQQVRR